MNKNNPKLKLNKNQENALAVVRCLAADGPLSQVQTTKQMHLGRTSVFNTFEALNRAGVLETGNGVAPVAKGRPCQLWQLNASLGVFVTVYTGVHARIVRVTDINGLTVSEKSSPSAQHFEEEFEQIVTAVRESASGHRILGVMLLLAGRIDFAAGVVSYSRTWELDRLPLRRMLQERLADAAPDAVILIENNCRMTAWGQRFGGSCTGLNHFMTLSIIEGRRNGKSTAISVGSGLVIDGRVYRGRAGGAGELDDNCYRWFKRVYSSREFPVSLLELDRSTRELFARDLGNSFAHLVNYLEPERVAVVFEQTPVEDFFEVLKRQIHSQLIYIDRRDLPVEISGDGVGSTLRGGLMLLREFYFGDTPRLLALLG